VWCGQDFGDTDASAGFLDEGHVGEGAANVDADPPGHTVTLRFRSRVRGT
jgi:hypothetical protein